MTLGWWWNFVRPGGYFTGSEIDSVEEEDEEEELEGVGERERFEGMMRAG